VPAVVALLTTPVTTTVVVTAGPTVPVPVVTAETAATEATATVVITPEAAAGRPVIIAARAAGTVVTPVEPTTTTTVVVTPEASAGAAVVATRPSVSVIAAEATAVVGVTSRCAGTGPVVTTPAVTAPVTTVPATRLALRTIVGRVGGHGCDSCLRVLHTFSRSRPGDALRKNKRTLGPSMNAGTKGP
ncbi:hypothetical protein IPZ64_33195, partial [Streptomyces violaceoruber]|nr:hypothetical protein [Streptomyces violaceoruber]